MSNTNCPNCGAVITSSTCEYCGTVFSSPEINHILEETKILERALAQEKINTAALKILTVNEMRES